MTEKLTEATVNLVKDYIQANIEAALVAVRDDTDNYVTLEAPKSYFIYPNAKGYRTPAIFVIAETFDFRLPDTGPNFINGMVSLNVSVLLEDRNTEHLTIRSWRYQAALHQVLAQAEILNSDNTVKVIVVVRKARFSPIFQKNRPAGSAEELFRKEVLFECEIEHYENL